jgi:hypothetical protein
MSVFGSSAADMVVNYDFFVLGYDFSVPCHGRPPWHGKNRTPDGRRADPKSRPITLKTTTIFDSMIFFIGLDAA